MSKYLISTTNTYRVASVEEALSLRAELQKNGYGELSSFNYTTKEVKSKGEVVDEYVIVKAKIDFNDQKEPMFDVDVFYGDPGAATAGDF